MKDLFVKSTAAAEETQSSEYQEVFDELESFVKSRAAVGKKKPSVSMESDTQDKEKEEMDEDMGQDKPLSKSVETPAKEEDTHEEGQVMDGEQVIQGFESTLKKSLLQVRNDLKELSSMLSDVMQANTVLAKSNQALMREVATLREQVDGFSNGGRPRKSLLKSVGAGEPAQTQGHYEGMEFGEIMNRATMVKSFSATDIGVIRQLVQTNQPIPKPAWEQIKNVKL